MVDTAQLQATLDKIPAYTWYANPTGGLTFVNTRCADYLGLSSDHPLRLGIDTGQSAGGGIVTYRAGGRQLVAMASGMKSPIWPGGSEASRIVVYGLPGR